MNPNWVAMAWLLGVLCGATAMISRPYLWLVALYVFVLSLSSTVGMPANGIVGDAFIVAGFVLVAIGAANGLVAIWKGK